MNRVSATQQSNRDHLELTGPPKLMLNVQQLQKISMAIPLLDGCSKVGEVAIAEALLTQRSLATCLAQTHAHYLFSDKGYQTRFERGIVLRTSSAFQSLC